MAKLRILIACIAGFALIAVAASALIPQSSDLSRPAAEEQAPARLTERQRSDLTPPRPRTLDYVSPSDLGSHHRIFVGFQPRSYVALSGQKPGGPMVVLLHGTGRDGRAMLDMWKDTPRSHGLTLVAPNGPNADWGPDDARLLVAAVKDAQTRYDTDPERVFLFGHSAGAMAAQLYANRFVGPWAAVATHGGYISPVVLQPVADGAPVRLYLGSSDQLFNPSEARETAKTLAAMGHPSEFHLIPEHGHWYYEIGPRLAAETADWFLQH